MMIHMQTRLIVKPKLSDFTAVLLHHTLILLLLTCGGQSSQPIVAMVGDDIILPCQMEPARDATALTVEWMKPDLDPRSVHLRRDGVELEVEENELYKGRTSLIINKLKSGDVSMKLSKVKLSDAGTYRCLVPTTGTDYLVELAVGSVASPDMKLSKVSNGVLLECKSKGWYPMPDVSWLDVEGKLLPAGPPETSQGPDYLYTVSSRVTVEKRHSNSFTCRVTQKNITQSRAAQIQVPDDLFLDQSNSAVRITICVLACIVTVGTLFFVVWKWGPNKTKTTNTNYELQPLMGVDNIRLQTMEDNEKVKYLEKIKVRLDEDLKKTEGEIEDVQQVIKTLTEQKKDLKEKKEKLISLQQEGRAQMGEKERKKKKTNVNSKKVKYESKVNDLKRRSKVHDELIEKTDKLLETTESLIIKMTERKGKLERDKEQINKNLTETERQREEMKRKLQSEGETQRNNPSSDEPHSLQTLRKSDI